jgi:hypothetical protein
MQNPLVIVLVLAAPPAVDDAPKPTALQCGLTLQVEGMS